ncbi:hypothetical protein F4V57_07610 [Acinetobacter qingfengensis]|uniref:Uncharacterized protein n=1 Tax=Acinetobacter qingfengensis TaxID=1262585 RepID=A0A1E7RAB6_9GAMM|nr:hypothetical protein [Acinetobacter qingfengensis]KAA8733907.1 hypothetical protein F4V57_07610 [Acinetobacter qingfengensis]OEY96173.1 hypothetical protein BJI46_12405 [Acinetobacter qingfengensis]
MIQITCYQTCKTDSRDWRVLYDEFPHHAKNSNEYQWLSDGYYFWPDSDHFAKWWGTDRLRQPYCITCYLIHIEYEKIFDMVGNVSHIKYFFEKLLKSYEALYEHSRKFSSKKLPKPTIATVIDHMRNFYKEETFNFKAMKVLDAWIDEEFCIDFTPNSASKKNEYFPGLARIQLCVFSDEKQCIQGKIPHYPNEYCDVIAKAS